MMKLDHYFLLLCVGCMFSLVFAKAQTISEGHGVHCGEITPSHDQQTPIDDYQCVHCLFPQNCLANNTCRLGTTGSTCERCKQHRLKQHRYHRVGSMCTICPDVPWAAIAFCIYIILFICFLFLTGFTEPVCTKMKLLCHFIQNLLITMHIKTDWPDDVLELVSYIGFASFNTNLINPDCMFPSWPNMTKHYMEWLTSIGIPIVVIVLGYFMDKSMKKGRTKFRRLVFFIVLMMYMPSTLSCVRTFLCSNVVPKELVLDHSENIFLLDNRADCETFSFQMIHFVASLYMIVIVIVFPLAIVFFTLRQKKWDLLYKQWDMQSPLYEAYKDKYCFWEAIPLLRKFTAIVVAEAYPFSPQIQTFIQLGTSAVYLLLILVLRPYRPIYWCHPLFNVHVIFEIISNLIICVVQGVALSIVFEQYWTGYSKICITLVCLVLIVWFAMMLVMSCETKEEVTLVQVFSSEDQEDEKTAHPSSKEKTKFWKSGKVKPDPKFVETVIENRQRINF